MIILFYFLWFQANTVYGALRGLEVCKYDSFIKFLQMGLSIIAQVDSVVSVGFCGINFWIKVNFFGQMIFAVYIFFW